MVQLLVRALFRAGVPDRAFFFELRLLLFCFEQRDSGGSELSFGCDERSAGLLVGLSQSVFEHAFSKAQPALKNPFIGDLGAVLLRVSSLREFDGFGLSRLSFELVVYGRWFSCWLCFAWFFCCWVFVESGWGLGAGRFGGCLWLFAVLPVFDFFRADQDLYDFLICFDKLVRVDGLAVVSFGEVIFSRQDAFSHRQTVGRLRAELELRTETSVFDDESAGA